MTSTQKQPKHHSYNSSTQDSEKPTRATGRPPAPYKSGSNVHKGNVPKPPKPVAMSEPFKKTY